MTHERRLINQTHVHRFVVNQDVRGWNVREEEDSTVIRQVHHEDWHRVEWDVLQFEQTALALKRTGWIDSQPHL